MYVCVCVFVCVCVVVGCWWWWASATHLVPGRPPPGQGTGVREARVGGIHVTHRSDLVRLDTAGLSSMPV